MIIALKIKIMNNIEFRKRTENTKAPQKAHSDDAGYDVYSNKDYKLKFHFKI